MFQPVVPFGGLAGWQFLSGTLDRQRQAHAQSADVQRDVDYFRQNIGQVQSVDDLMDDRRLLRVALGAFGLEQDLGNRFFIRKVLTDGTQDEQALSNRIANKAYRKLSQTFGFGDRAVPNTVLPGFADQIAAAYLDQSFEVKVGETDNNLRLALNLQRELPDIAGAASNDDTKWLTIMGSGPLRAVFDKAFGLPSSFAALDLDRQVETYRDKALRAFGSAEASQFSQPDALEKLTRQFLVRSQATGFNPALLPAQTALSLLGG